VAAAAAADLLFQHFHQLQQQRGRPVLVHRALLLLDAQRARQ
jgi:hypothetical protein